MLTRITTAIIAALLICTSGLAQNLRLTEKLSSLVESAPIIIEGVVDSEKSSRYDAQGKIVTDHYIRVIKTIKGSVDSELLRVVVSGGKVGNWIQGSSHPVTLDANDQGVFFLTMNSTDDVGAYKIHGGNVGKITKLSGQSQYDAIHRGTLDTYKSWRKLKEAIYSEVGYGEDVKSITPNEFSRLTDDIELCVKLDNPTPNYVDNTVDFDVLAKSSVAGIKFAKAEITLDYPAGNLGEWIVQQEKIEAKKSDITDGDAYTIEVLDQTKEQIILDVDSDCDSSDPHYTLSTGYEKLATVKVEVENWGDFGNMSIDQFEIDGTAEYIVPNSFQGSSNTCADFDNVCGDADGDFNFQTCSVTSESQFTNAGTQQVIEIQGSGFGDGTISDSIFIPRANLGGLEWKGIGATNRRIVRSWKDDIIVLNVLDVMEGDVGNDDPAGSGYWRIKPSDSGLRCETLIEVGYSLEADVIEVIQDSFFREERYIYPIAGIQSEYGYPVTGALEVYVDSISLAANNIDTSLFREVVREVICKWEANSIIEINYKGITSIPDRSSTDLGPASNPSTILVVSFGTPISGGLAETQSFFFDENLCGDDTYSYFVDKDLVINNNSNFYFGLGGPDNMVSGQTDLQSVLLHEFGHILGHSHANDIDTTNLDFDERVMYPTLPPPSLFKFQRNSLESHASSGAVEFWRHTNVETQSSTSSCTTTTEPIIGTIDIDPDKATCSTNSTQQIGSPTNEPCFKVSIINQVAHFSDLHPNTNDFSIKSASIYNTLGQEIFTSILPKGSNTIDMSEVNYSGIVILSLTDHSGAVCSIQLIL